MRYVEIILRSTYAAFARALSYGSSRLVKGPVVRTRHSFEESGRGNGDAARVALGSRAVKYPPLNEVYGDTAGEAAPIPSSEAAALLGVSVIVRNVSDESFNVARGRCSSRILMIAAR